MKTQPAERKTSIEHLVAPESLAQGFVLVVRDQTGLATPESPIYIACNLNKWNPADPAWKLVQQADGRWLLAVRHHENGEVLVFKFTCAGRDELDAKGGRGPSARRLSVVDASTRPSRPDDSTAGIELSVNRWADRAGAGGSDAKK